MKYPIGTFVNMLTVTIGSLIGLYFHSVIDENVKTVMFQAISLGVMILGIKMALDMPKNGFLVFIFSLIIGGIIGKLLHLDQVILELGNNLKILVGSEDNNFVLGLTNAFLLFCVGSMTIVGAIEEGLEGKRDLLYTKSTLDGFSSIAFASTFGIGVLFSIVPMLIFQGGITVLASKFKNLFKEDVISMVSAVGGVLIVALSLNMLEVANIQLENILPALFIAPLIFVLKNKFIGEN